jgi:hypothetical protein
MSWTSGRLVRSRRPGWVAPDLLSHPTASIAFSAVVDGRSDIYVAHDGGWAPVTTSGDATAPSWGLTT